MEVILVGANDQDCLCPGCFNVWLVNGANWCKIHHIDSWGLEDDVEEATRKRTSDTNGLSVKFCSDIIGYDVEVVTTICGDRQWLFNAILEDPRVLANGKCTWFFFSWDCDVNQNGPAINPDTLETNDPNGIPSFTSKGVLAFGQVRPPAFGGDNTDNEVATGTFSVNVSKGPFLPIVALTGNELCFPVP